MPRMELETITTQLSPSETIRYARHLSMRSIGMAGQKRLLASKVLVVGAGGLGSPALMYLAAAGIGTIGIIDDDYVDITNLQRQVIHRTHDIGASKVESAARFIQDINPELAIIEHKIRLTDKNALEIIEGYDCVVDASDNFSTRYLVNDACVLLNKPCIWGSVYQFTGQVSVFWSEYGPCYRCLFPEPPPKEYAPSCSQGGVVGAICGVVGAIQSAEVVKLAVGNGDSLIGRMWLFDGEAGQSVIVSIPRNPSCPSCSKRETKEILEVPETSCHIERMSLPSIEPMELDAVMKASQLDRPRIALFDIRNEYEWASGHIPGANLVGPDWVENPIVPDNTDEIIIYCESGVRSATALERLIARGIHVKHLNGGLQEWRRFH